MVAPPRRALVVYPKTESYTTQALLKAFEAVLPDWQIDTGRDDAPAASEQNAYDLQYCDYDEIDFDAAENAATLVNSYVLRKALIRKNYLATAVSHRLAKQPGSILAKTIPRTFPFEIAHADELDELFYDELYDVAQSLENDEGKTWWILKPALADKGQGIRLFNSRESLEAILESFEDDESDDDEEEDAAQAGSTSKADTSAPPDTRVSLQSMRDWVIQEYLDRPLLFSMDELSGRALQSDRGRKFHLRVYVLAIGDLEVYVYTDMLALFAAKDYVALGRTAAAAGDEIEDLTCHLTNTCLQTPAVAEESVFLLSDLIGKAMLHSDASAGEAHSPLSAEQVGRITRQIGEVTAEVFQAGLAMPNHFSTSANAFEVFGVDIVLSSSGDAQEDITVHLLEVNACPDFRQTGHDRHTVIEELFKGVLEIAVKPFFDPDGSHGESWECGQQRGKWLKCLSKQ